MILLKAYQYLFYKLYRFYETSTYSRWWSEWKSIVTILVLEMWTINSISIYYHFFSDVPIVSSNSAIDVSTIVVGIIFAVIKWYLFYYRNKWKDIVKEFDKLPKNQNRIGSVIVLVVVLILIANLIFSISLLSQVKYD